MMARYTYRVDGADGYGWIAYNDDGHPRFCVWGDTREEAVEKAREIIKAALAPFRDTATS